MLGRYTECLFAGLGLGAVEKVEEGGDAQRFAIMQADVGTGLAFS